MLKDKRGLEISLFYYQKGIFYENGYINLHAHAFFSEI